MKHTKIKEDDYLFNLESKYLRKIQKYVFIPIYLMADTDIFLQFSDGVHYVLKSLEELSKMCNHIDLEAEIDKAKVYFEELERLYHEINNLANKTTVAVLLDKHHENMENLISLLKEF